jgi:hypothetical protein
VQRAASPLPGFGVSPKNLSSTRVDMIIPTVVVIKGGMPPLITTTVGMNLFMAVARNSAPQTTHPVHPSMKHPTTYPIQWRTPNGNLSYISGYHLDPGY